MPAGSTSVPSLALAPAHYEKTTKWQACLNVHMAPVYAELLMLEKQVARLGREYHGEPDGWGCSPASL